MTDQTPTTMPIKFTTDQMEMMRRDAHETGVPMAEQIRNMVVIAGGSLPNGVWADGVFAVDPDFDAELAALLDRERRNGCEGAAS